MLNHSGTERVDALQLDLGYTAPALRAEDTGRGDLQWQRLQRS